MVRATLSGEEDGLVQVSRLSKPQEFWREFLRDGPTEAELALFRRHARTGRPLGEGSFLDRLERLTGRSLHPKRAGRKRKPPSEIG